MSSRRDGLSSWHRTTAACHVLACVPPPSNPLPRLTTPTSPDLIPSPAERALNTYCGLHRLLLALCDRHGLWERAERRVGRFLSQEAQRTKEQAPNLGLLVPLLAASRRHDWREVRGRGAAGPWVGGCGSWGLLTAAVHPSVLRAQRRTLNVPSTGRMCPSLPLRCTALQVLPVVLGESMDRQVLWACKADRSLIDRYRVDPQRGGVDGLLVAGAFEASRVSLRWAPCLPV